MIKVTSHVTTAEAQTYSFDCGAGGVYPVGNKVRVRSEDTTEPLEIAEISVNGLMISKCHFVSISLISSQTNITIRLFLQ